VSYRSSRGVLASLNFSNPNRDLNSAPVNVAHLFLRLPKARENAGR
jgi:hypothetical protein